VEQHHQLEMQVQTMFTLTLLLKREAQLSKVLLLKRSLRNKKLGGERLCQYLVQ
jgi:hypothetical protein